MNAQPVMNTRPQDRSDCGFLIGFVAGSAIGAGLAMYFAPRAASALRKGLAASAATLRDAATGLRDTATERYQQASTRVVDAVDDLTSRGQKARDAAADVVARGAHEVARGANEVERFAVAAKTGKH